MDEVTTTAGKRRVRTIAVAAATLVGLGLALPSGADASPGTPPGYHGCFPVTFYNDEGPVTDLVHHNVEPLAESVIPGTGLAVHNLNCQVSALGL